MEWLTFKTTCGSSWTCLVACVCGCVRACVRARCAKQGRAQAQGAAHHLVRVLCENRVVEHNVEVLLVPLREEAHRLRVPGRARRGAESGATIFPRRSRTQASISVCAVAGCSNPRHWTHGHRPLRGLEQPLPFRILPERLQQHPHGVFRLVAAVACVRPSCHLFAVFVAKTREQPIVARNSTYPTALADSTRCHLLQVI